MNNPIVHAPYCRTHLDQECTCNWTAILRGEADAIIPPGPSNDIVSKVNAALKDSGERREFSTGAQRDRGATKGRPDLRPVHALHRLDVHMEKGAAKYEDRNWEKGMPLSEFYNSATRHAEKLLAGYTDEDHAAAWLWNVACFIETRHRVQKGLLPPELDDMPRTFEGKEPGF